MTIPLDRIRNFCIIAHIDHGKSTLADRLLQVTGTVSERESRAQLLDTMDLERERGITIKASAVRRHYRAADGEDYLLNLIDTPGHVDFSYEVSKALAACEGVLLLVDAAQGVEAQTVANLYQALEHDLVIIPVINKIDLTQARVDEVEVQILEILPGHDRSISRASAKEGTGITEILERIVTEIPPPSGDPAAPLQALIFDSMFDTYKGVIAYVRIVNGQFRPDMRLRFMALDAEHDTLEVGIFAPKLEPVDVLECGTVGYFSCNLRDASQLRVGDTVTNANAPAAEPLPGYRESRPMVFCGIYPTNSKDFQMLREAMAKLVLSDASVVYEQESSPSFGYGFRCGFLGLLHMEIVQERLEREYDLNLLITTPSVAYQVTTVTGEEIEVDNPSQMLEPHRIRTISEPMVRASLLIPHEAVGAVMELAMSRRGRYRSTEYVTEGRAIMIYELPLAEIIVDFFDKLKSITRGYGSMDYEFIEFQPAKVVRLDILINGELCDAFSSLVIRERAEIKGRALIVRLKELIHRQLFEVILQAVIGGRVLARERVAPVGKQVTAKCYGGDITRKRKLREKQKAGKKRMKQFGRVEIPQEAFLAVLQA